MRGRLLEAIIALMMVWMLCCFTGCSEAPQPEETLSCRLNSDCPIGELCQEGTCVEDEVGCQGPDCPCLQDSDCGAAEACEVETGDCIPIECLQDNDCALGDVCVDAQCVTDVNADRDRDGVPDNEDDCPEVADSEQEDNDDDGQGDACDLDDDNDGLFDGSDNCPRVANLAQHDHDDDGQGNACDEDWVGLALTGRVVSPLPIDVNVAGTVALRGASGQAQILALSGEGSFSAQGLEVGVYELRVSVDGHIPEVRVIAMQDLDIDLGDVTVVPESGDEAATLRGQATLSDGASPEGVFVRSTLGDTTLTDEEGRFELQLARLSQQLVMTRDGYQSATFDIQWNADAEDGGRFEVNGEDTEAYEGFTLAADLSARLSGRLVTPLENVDFAADATVRLVSESTRLLQVESEGVFRGDTLRPGLYALQIEARGHLPQSTLVSIGSGDNDLGEFSLVPEFEAPENAAQLVGRVELGEGPDDGVVVRYILNDVPVDTTVSDEAGVFSFPAARTTAQLSFQREGYVSRTITIVYSEERARFEFEGRDLSQTAIELSPEPAEGVVRVRFSFEPDWIPADQRHVSLRVLGPDYSANRPRVVESEEAEIFTSVPDGDFTVRASRAGFGTVEQVITLNPQRRDLTLEMTITLTDMAQARLDLEGTTLNDEQIGAALNEGVRFSGADLSGINLSGNFNDLALDLSGVDLSNANLAGAELRGVNFAGANFFGANAQGVQLARANLTGANFASANFANAQFREVDEPIPGSPCAEDAQRPAVTLTNAAFSQTILNGVDMRGVNLEAADLDGASLNGALMSSACLRRSNLILANLSDANFDFADLSEASMINAILIRTSLRGALMDRASLGSAVFELADLSCLREELRFDPPDEDNPPLNPCDDAFEPNDDVQDATPLAIGALSGLGLCPGDDEEDFFAMTLGEGQEVDLRVHFDPQTADIDIQLLDADLEVLDFSQGTVGLERVTFTAQSAGTIYLRVYRFSGGDVSYQVERLDEVLRPICQATSMLSVNLNGANLIGTDFTGADLTGASMVGAIVGQANDDDTPIATSFQDARMVGISANGLSFDAADFTRANLSRALLNNVSFQETDLTDANLSQALLNGASVQGDSLTGTNFTDAVLNGAVLDGLTLESVALNNAELNGTSFVECVFNTMSFDGADFTRADLTLARLTDADLRGAKFNDTTLAQVEIVGGDLSAVNLSGADLTGAFISGVSMQGIILDSAILRNATLIQVDMTNGYANGADLTLALLEETSADRCDFQRSTFSNTQLVDVSLVAADLTRSSFSNVVTEGTIDMSFATLEGAIFVFSQFSRATLTQAFMDNVIVDSVDFDRANFDGTSMRNARVLFTDFTNTSAVGANMFGSTWLSSDLTSADLSEADISQVEMSGNTMDYATFNAADMELTRLRNASLIRANLDSANLLRANLTGAILFYATLNNASAHHINLQNAALDNAQCVGINLSQATLDQATLDFASFQGAQLLDATLRDASVTDTDFSEANIIRADFTGIRYTLSGPPFFNRALINGGTAFDDHETLPDDVVDVTDGLLADITIDGGDFSAIGLGGVALPDTYSFTVDNVVFTNTNFFNGSIQSVAFTDTTFRSSNLDASLTNVRMDNVTMENVIAPTIQTENLVVVGGDFSGTSFYRADFRGAQFSDAVLSGCDLRGALFLGATLENVAMDGAIYDSETVWPLGFEPNLLGAVNIDEGGDLSDAQLTGALFVNPLSAVDFTRADLTRAEFSDAVEDVDFTSADLTGALFFQNPTFSNIVTSDAVFDEVAFTDVNATGLTFEDISMRDADFTECTMSNTSLSGADLSEARFNTSQMDSMDARGVVASQLTFFNTDALDGQWAGSELTRADLRNSSFAGSDMSTMTLTDSITVFTDFSQVDFSGSDLRRTLFFAGQFTGADFTNADLSGVRFELVDLEGVDFTGANLTGATFVSVKCPNGTRSELLYGCGLL